MAKAEPLKKMFGFTIAGQFITLVLSGMVLDGGVAQKVTAICVVVHWVMVIYLLIRRRKSLTESDCAMIKGGYLLLVVLYYIFVLLGGLLPRYFGY